MMNCIYDCEYCFLKGMYPSGNLVIFVNIEDFLNEIESRLKEHSIYLCVSYDTDMLALEPITQYAKILSEFTENILLFVLKYEQKEHIRKTGRMYV